jgi:hypothetical protein
LIDGAHYFVVSIATAVSDDQTVIMTDQERVENMSCPTVKLTIWSPPSMSVANLGIALHLFDVTAPAFDTFIIYFQFDVVSSSWQSWLSCLWNKKHVLWHIQVQVLLWKGWNDALPNKYSTADPQKYLYRQTFRRQLASIGVNWRQALREIWGINHSNFMRWIFLECLLEMQMQTHFVQVSTSKTFVDQLLALQWLQQVMTIRIVVGC